MNIVLDKHSLCVVCFCSQLGCKAAVSFFHWCVLLNFSWLLVEALYLQTLLLFTFTHVGKLLWIYAAVGWGASCVYTCSGLITCTGLHLTSLMLQELRQ